MVLFFAPISSYQVPDRQSLSHCDSWICRFLAWGGAIPWGLEVLCLYLADKKREGRRVIPSCQSLCSRRDKHDFCSPPSWWGLVCLVLRAPPRCAGVGGLGMGSGAWRAGRVEKCSSILRTSARLPRYERGARVSEKQRAVPDTVKSWSKVQKEEAKGMGHITPQGKHTWKLRGRDYRRAERRERSEAQSRSNWSSGN